MMVSNDGKWFLQQCRVFLTESSFTKNKNKPLVQQLQLSRIEYLTLRQGRPIVQAVMTNHSWTMKVDSLLAPSAPFSGELWWHLKSSDCLLMSYSLKKKTKQLTVYTAQLNVWGFTTILPLRSCVLACILSPYSNTKMWAIMGKNSSLNSLLRRLTPLISTRRCRTVEEGSVYRHNAGLTIRTIEMQTVV